MDFTNKNIHTLKIIFSMKHSKKDKGTQINYLVYPKLSENHKERKRVKNS